MSSPITSISLSPNSATLAAATPDQLLLTKPSAETAESVQQDFSTKHDIPHITSLTLPSSNILYTATARGVVTRHRLTPTLETDFSITAAHSAHAITSIAALSPTSTIATSAKDGLIKLWDPSTATSTAILSGHRYEVRRVAIATSTDDTTPVTLIASAGRDKTVRLWDSRTDKPLATLKGHSSWVHSVALSSSPSPIAVSCGGDKTVRVWDLLTMTERTTFRGHEYRVWDVAIPAHATYCLSASTDATVRAWEIDGEGTHSFERHHDSVLCLAAARDGRFFVSGCEDGQVLVWPSAGLFGHQPRDGDLVTEEEAQDKVQDESLPKEVVEEVAQQAVGGDQLVDVGGHVGRSFDGVPLQMDTTPLVSIDTENRETHRRQPDSDIVEVSTPQIGEKAQSSPRKTQSSSLRTQPSTPKTHSLTPRTHPSTPRTHPSTPRTHPSTPRTHPSTPMIRPSTPKMNPVTPNGASTRTRSTPSPVRKQDTESLKAAIAVQPEQTPSYDKSAAELVRALQRISELEKSLREANDAATAKDREISALKTSVGERDATIARLSAEVDTSKALLHEANVRALLEAQPRKADIALDYDEPVNKIGAVSDQLSRLAARLDAMIATN